jgi:hypothetical protein
MANLSQIISFLSSIILALSGEIVKLDTHRSRDALQCVSTDANFQKIDEYNKTAYNIFINSMKR